MDLHKFWQYEAKDVLAELQSAETGLSPAAAAKRLSAMDHKKKERSQLFRDIILCFSQFKSPLTLLLVAAVILSAFLGETSDVFIILFILLATGIMSFIQERHAGLALENLVYLPHFSNDVTRSQGFRLIELPGENFLSIHRLKYISNKSLLQIPLLKY